MNNESIRVFHDVLLDDLERIRQFASSGTPVLALTAEQRRKNFISLDANGRVAIYNTTAHREVFLQQLATEPARTLAISRAAQ